MATLFPCRCFSSDCRDTLNSQRIIYLDAIEDVACPNCNRKGNIVQCEQIHLLVEDPDGPIKGSMMLGTADVKYNFLCQHARENFNAYKQNPIRHYTSLPDCATCVECLLEYGARLIGHTIKLPS